ncbi:SAM-dependent methyltransferase [Amycolatopsis sp. La24]|uniref:SAM-dependent methyltransferase n=1 Tax=Amycolatopsis sp. La24 TaxID=3028304 RepID=UPI0023B1020B|nr:SAM-dependent methyltransferase [Amycolatopsis sp. La24]
MSEELPPVGKTAVGVAGLRALESGRPDRLFDDPYAGAFFHAGRAIFEGRERHHELGMVFAHQVAIRTRFFDDFVSGGTQTVLLAAGLDARAFRLDWPDGARVFEVDLPDVLAFKETVLSEKGARPRCQRTTVPVDLRDDWVAALKTTDSTRISRPSGSLKGCSSTSAGTRRSGCSRRSPSCPRRAAGFRSNTGRTVIRTGCWSGRVNSAAR